jgi:lysophospholipase L1-like esterase
VIASVIRAAVCLVLCVPLITTAAEGDRSRWQAEFAAFSRADLDQPPQSGGVVFVGSSSIRLWDGLERAFARFPTVLKRGFGGSTMSDCAENVERLVTTYEPRTVVVYAGENDLAAGATPDDVLHSVRRFVADVRRRQPDTHLAFVSIKPSPLRAALLPAIREANARVSDFLAAVPNSQFIDVHSLMLDPAGAPRAELFSADQLHLNADGYALWRREINARLP